MRQRGWTQPKALRVGERVRYLDGSLWRVESESSGGAHLRCYKGSGAEYEREVEFKVDTVRGKKVVLDEPRRGTFKMTTGKNHAGDLEWVSSYSLLERVEEEGDVTTTKTDGADLLAIAATGLGLPAAADGPNPVETKAAKRGARMADKDALKAKSRAPKKAPLNTAAVNEKVAAVAAPVANVLETIARAVTQSRPRLAKTIENAVKKTSATVKQDKPAAASSAAKELTTMKTTATKKTTAKAKPETKKKPTTKAPAARKTGDGSPKRFIKGTEGGADKYRDPKVELPAGKVRGTGHRMDEKEIAELVKLRKKDPDVFTYRRLALIFGITGTAAMRICER